VHVEDTGAGIPSEHLPHIFERFRQVDSSTTRAHGGLGLGLAIVRYLVEAHGGNVEAQSEGVGRGATFTISLPVRAVRPTTEETEAEGRAQAIHLPGTPGYLENVRVLVVEDDADSLDLVREVLEQAGARVTGASSAGEALRAPGPFDVIVSDIGMPGMDGYALIRRVREVDANTPALALTAYARAEDVEYVKRAGYQEHLGKPVDTAKLLDAISRWSRRRKSELPS
jgi:CheY-like chemotaxis protein